MTVHVYTFAWNEERLLPFFLRHYLDWLGAARVVVYDNESTDRTAEICAADPRVERRVYKTGGVHTEPDGLVPIRNRCWKESALSAELAVIVDCDELLFHNDMPGFLGYVAAQPAAAVRASGYEMVSRHFPAGPGVHLPAAVRRGVRSTNYDKVCGIFPSRVRYASFGLGALDCVVEPALPTFASAGLRLLHYPRLGWDFYIDRINSRRARAAVRDAKVGAGRHYRRTDEQIRNEFDSLYLKAVDVVT